MRKTQIVGASLFGLGLSFVGGCDSFSPEVANHAVIADADTPDAIDAPCVAHQTDLIAGQHTNTGSVQVSNDNESISIAVLAADPYRLAEIHVYVGTGPVPGNGAPGQFPYVAEFRSPVGDHQIEVPLADLAVACGDDLTIAVHAVVVSLDGQFEETAWGFGPDELGLGWGWSFGHEVCCPSEGVDPVDPVDPVDGDQDGVDVEHDCDDNDPRIGALLYENHFDDDDGYLGLGPQLLDPWTLWGSEIHTTDGGQQALLGQAETWGDTVTFGTLRVSAVETECGNACAEDNTRFRAGFLARTSEDADQDEGFHGYRCAVANNSGVDCYDPGAFVQLAAFLDTEEDDINSECVDGCVPNPSFDQLDREEHSDATDFIAGDSGALVFWAVGQDLVCEFYGNEDEHVVARAVDDRFDSGTTGLSTLNALADFDHVKVCQAFEAP
jgi:hypothetical protein